MPSSRRLILLILCCLTAGGCATVRSLDAYREGDPLIMAGTKLNVAALNSRGAPAERFRNVVPPRYPALDLPFSLMADTLLIPMLFPAAIVTSFTHRAN